MILNKKYGHQVNILKMKVFRYHFGRLGIWGRQKVQDECVHISCNRRNESKMRENFDVDDILNILGNWLNS